jgi:hypothetical protein
MRQAARPVHLTPVEDSATPQRYDLYADPNVRHMLRQERSSAYWFAATKWGMVGLIVGIALGAFTMYVSNMSMLPTAVEAVAQGQAIGQAASALDGGSR